MPSSSISLMLRTLVHRVARHDGLNFHLTNRIPRRLATRFMGWFSRIEHPLVAALSIRALQFFAGDLRLHEARDTTFRSLRDCFVRELRPGSRPVDHRPGVLVSPCDGLVVARGAIHETTLVQAKSQAYTLEELLIDQTLVDRHRHGSYVTMRLTPAMYHRFHAPCDGVVEDVRFVPGDTWNVNPATLARVDRVYCRNTRAILPLRTDDSNAALTLVPVGAVLVSSIHLAFLPERAARQGVIPCRARLAKGDEMGHFEHGSTIVALAAPGLVLGTHVTPGALMRVGQPLWHDPAAIQ
jgi:phosphatidylserine decarboxylase